MIVELYINNVFQSNKGLFSTPNITFNREENEMFRRNTINGEFVFAKEDYDAIVAAGLEGSFKIIIKDGTTTLGEASFVYSDLSFDADNKTATIRITTKDRYDKLLAGLDDEYNLIELIPERSEITLQKRAIIQIYFKGDKKITNVIGSMSYEIDANSSVVIDGESVNVEDLTSDQIVGALHFGQISTDAIEIGFTDSYLLTNYPDAQGEYTLVSHSGDVYNYSNGKGGTISFTYISSEISGDTYFGNIAYNGSFIVFANGDRVWAEYGERNNWVKRDDFYGGAHHLTDEVGSIVNLIGGWVFARVLCDVQSNVPLSGGVYPVPKSDICSTNLNYRYVMPIASNEPALGGFANFIITSYETQAAPTKWGMNGIGQYYVRPASRFSGSNVIPIGFSKWVPASFWFESVPAFLSVLDGLYISDFVLRDAYSISSVINALLGKIDNSIVFSEDAAHSEFLYGSAANIMAGYHKQKLFITQITNVKRTYYDEAARKGTITLRQVFTLLKGLGLYYYIDGNNLRIEHLLFFKNGSYRIDSPEPFLDLTNKYSTRPDKTWVFDTNKFDFDKERLPKRYEYAWNEACGEAFNGFSINIGNKYVGDKTQRLQISNFVSDVDMILSAPDALSDDCFVAIGTESDNRCPIVTLEKLGMAITAPKYVAQNGYMSLYYLELAYHLYNMSGDNATTDEYSGSLNVQGLARARRQKITFPMSIENALTNGIIRTGLGDGDIENVTWTDGIADSTLYIGNEVIQSPYILVNGAKNLVLNYDYNAREVILNISSNVTWTVTGGGTITVEKLSATSAKLTLPENSGAERSQSFSFKANGVTLATLDVTQGEYVEYTYGIYLNPSEIFYDIEGGRRIVMMQGITYADDIEISRINIANEALIAITYSGEQSDWLSLIKSGFVATENEGGERNASIRVSWKGEVADIAVTQASAESTISYDIEISPTLAKDSESGTIDFTVEGVTYDDEVEIDRRQLTDDEVSTAIAPTTTTWVKRTGFTLDFEANDGEARSVELVVLWREKGLTKRVPITQQAPVYTYAMDLVKPSVVLTYERSGVQQIAHGYTYRNGVEISKENISRAVEKTVNYQGGVEGWLTVLALACIASQNDGDERRATVDFVWPSHPEATATQSIVQKAQENEPLKFTNTGDSSSEITINNYGGNAPTLQKSLDSLNWDTWDYTEITLQPGESIYIKGDNPNGFNFSSEQYSTIRIFGVIDVSGNVMSLLGEDVKDIPCDYCFAFLFYAINDADVVLPATILKPYCYREMFGDCGIISAPELPATTLADYCYYSMFWGCDSLVNAPELPATTLSEGCYNSMFSSCDSLVNAPELPATTLADFCYQSMFVLCKSLVNAPELPATTLADYCYGGMFSLCESLNYIKCKAENVTSSKVFTWVNGVAAIGTFVKKTGVNWPSGISGIPEGWTVIEED